MLGDLVRQTRAASLLLIRYLARRAVRGGAGPTYAKSRAPWFLLLSLVWTLYVGNLLWSRFADAALKPLAEGPPAMAWQLIGVVLAMVGFGFVELAPELGRIRPPLRITLLDELPFSVAARLMLVWFRNPFMPALTIVGALAWSPAARVSFGGVMAVSGFALAIYLAATTLGYALGSWIRVLFSGRGRRAISIASLVLVLVGVQLLVFSERFHHLIMPPAPALDAALDIRAGALGAIALVAIGVWLVGMLAIAWAERVGYDRLDALPAGVKRGRSVALDARAIERLLTRREGGLGLAIVGWLFFVMVAVGAGFAIVKPPEPDVTQKLVLGICVAVAYLGAVIALSRAGQAVRRDAGARAFLAPLPIAPYQTLDGKVQAVRGVVLPLMLCAVPGIALALDQASVLGPIALEVAWRSLATVLVVWVGADAAVSIAFLTGGVGLPGVKSMGAPTSFAVQLLLLPLLAASAAPDPVVALASVAAVFAIALEARRAAHLAVRWLDDAADDLTRETTVWRALLALAAFYAAQALGGELLGLGDLPDAVRGALVVMAAGVILVILTLQGRRALGPLRWWPSSPIALLVGPLAGAVSALAALGFAFLVRHVTNTSTPAAPALTPLESIVAVFAVTIAAPIAEEIFFRGWLQSAIANDLSAKRKKWAFAIAGLAFALAHVGSWIVPQLVMGLLAGLLYARWKALVPTVLAHTTHNALVLALSGVFLGSQ